MHMINTTPAVISFQPEIDIVSRKMLEVLGYDTSPATYKVRRKLFGCCNESADATISESLAELETEDAERSSRVWNFDFFSESPLPAGRYAWEKVRNCDVPLWYTSEDNASHDNRLCVVQVSARAEVEECKQDQLAKHTDCDRCQISKNSQQNKTTTKSKSRRLVQTNIKGYTKVQKKGTRKRLGSKQAAFKFIKGPSRVADYILRSQDASVNS